MLILVIPQYCKRNTVPHIQYPLALVTVQVTIARFEAVTSTYKSIVELTAWIHKHGTQSIILI